MSNSPDVAVAGSDKSPESSLTEAQVSAFWAGIIANGDAARRMAREFVSKQDADDVVSTASILFLESFQRPTKPARFPAGEEEFRRRYLVIVRNHAIDCVRDSDAAGRPARKYWGVQTEPSVGGRKTADRPLDHVFARNDKGSYDAPATADTRVQDTVDELDRILREAVARLPRMQRMVITETFFEKKKRAAVSAQLGMRAKTYDSHLQAAFNTLRDELWVDAWNEMDDDRSTWYDRIEELSDRYDDALGKRIEKQLVDLARLREQLFPGRGEGDKNSREGAA